MATLLGVRKNKRKKENWGLIKIIWREMLETHYLIDEKTQTETKENVWRTHTTRSIKTVVTYISTYKVGQLTNAYAYFSDLRTIQLYFLQNSSLGNNVVSTERQIGHITWALLKGGTT